MKVLVTGGAGFIGSSVVDALLTDGYSVVAIDNFDEFYDPDIKRDNLANAIQNDQFELVEGDIRNVKNLEECFSKDIDLVIHLAARAGVRPSIEQPILYYDVNINGTLNLLETMRKHECKQLLFASSSSVYGNNEEVPFSESDPVDHPISPYAASKKAGELLCYTYHHLHNFNIFCFRYFTVYGPRQRPEMAIHAFTRNIMNGLPINMFGDGSSQRDYTYIDDIVSGVMNAIPRLKGYEVLNLGESQTIKLKDLITLIQEATGKEAIIEQLPQQPGDVDITFADISKAKALLEYNPQFPVEEGIRRFVEWYHIQLAMSNEQ
ncbi:MAG: GDP-mannose 4,6-dehydratase [Bacteroidetes bacterium]|nr:GDP-mannose 4,6-dehydratase [Bacteroidota bacterium]